VRMPRAKKPELPPHFLIIAGPNGSGKTTAYKKVDLKVFGQSVWIINPDALAARIRKIEKKGLDDANRESVIRIGRWLDSSIDAHQSVGVETVLSTDKYRERVLRAKALGFTVTLVYVILDSPNLNIERVRQRVARGGHDVPREKIVARYTRSLNQMPWFLNQANNAVLYDNSGEQLKLIGIKQADTLSLDKNAIPAVIAAINAGPDAG